MQVEWNPRSFAEDIPAFFPLRLCAFASLRDTIFRHKRGVLAPCLRWP